MEISLPLNRDEFLALDDMIRFGAVTRFPLLPPERLALSIWKNSTKRFRV